MSWQSAFACWFLRRQFYPQTLSPTISVEHARKSTAKRIWSPRVPRGWVLREQYGIDDAPLRGEWLEPLAAPKRPAPARTILYFHGGGYYFCSPRSHRSLVFELARRANTRTFSLDYRLAPEHRFPAALDDSVAAYRQLLAEGTPAESIVIAGDSAGGGLALATLVALRDAGDALPAGGLLFSPWTDLAATGASYESRATADPIHQRAMIKALAKNYLGEHGDPRDPLASPLYADVAGLPPLLIQVGDRETVLDDSTSFADKARAAGVEVELEVWDNMIHVFQMFGTELAEARQAVASIAKFLARRLHIHAEGIA